MDDEFIGVTKSAFGQFVKSARQAATPELQKLVQATIYTLCDMDAIGMFDDVAARHLWDEYCWQLQEVPYDSDDFGFGSTSEGFEETLCAVVAEKIDALPQYMQLFLSIHVRDPLDTADDAGNIGTINRDAISDAVVELVNQCAARRNLEIIGPNRDYYISMEISLDGLAGEALSAVGEQSDFLSEHVDQMLQGGTANANAISHTLLKRYMELVNEDESLLLALFERFEKDIRALVLEKDIRPAVDNAIGQLEEILDDETPQCT